MVRSGQAADVVGTKGYLAPEVEAGRPVSSAADVFALGRFLHASGATVVAALAQSDVLAWRAESADELRAALPIPADAAPFRGEIRGPAALHDVLGRARRLRDTASGRVWLDRLCAAGFGRPEPDGGRRLHPAELNRWQALSEAPLSPTAAWSAIEAGAPARAVWGLLAGLADGSPVTVEWVDVLGLATIEALDPALLRYVRVMLGRVVTTDPACAAWWGALLGAALRARGTGTATVLSELQATGVPDRMVARRAWSVVLFRVALSVGLEPARAVLTTLEQATEPLDPDREVRIQAWRGLLAYRAGDYSLAGELLEGAWSRRQFDHLAAVTASNLVAVWLHVDRPDRAELVGRAALQRLTPGAHPRAAARLAAKLREAVYRAHAAPSPDLSMLEAISVASAPVGVALATLTEAAAAWRSGDLVTAARLADETAMRFEATGILGGYLLAAALAWRTGHPDWARAADRVEARVDILDEDHGPYLPAVAAQVLGMLATSPESAWPKTHWTGAGEWAVDGAAPGCSRWPKRRRRRRDCRVAEAERAQQRPVNSAISARFARLRCSRRMPCRAATVPSESCVASLSSNARARSGAGSAECWRRELPARWPDRCASEPRRGSVRPGCSAAR